MAMFYAITVCEWNSSAVEIACLLLDTSNTTFSSPMCFYVAVFNETKRQQ